MRPLLALLLALAGALGCANAPSSVSIAPALGVYAPRVQRETSEGTQRQLAGIAAGATLRGSVAAASVSIVPTWIAVTDADGVRDEPAAVVAAEMRLLGRAGAFEIGAGVAALHRWSAVWRAWEARPVASAAYDLGDGVLEVLVLGARECVVRVVVGR